MHAVSTSPNNSNGPSNISGPLRLPSTIARGCMTSDDRCYCLTRGMCTVATSDGHSDISGLSLWGIVAMG
jgi:hypothetical protein